RDVKGGLGRIFEFTGPGVDTLSVPERGTICNMIAELGATTGIFPSDARTKEWLTEQKRPADFVELKADPGASYDEREVIDLAKLEPLIAKPSSPGNVVPAPAGAGTTLPGLDGLAMRDRKSTRLNSSHDQTSYALFC